MVNFYTALDEMNVWNAYDVVKAGHSVDLLLLRCMAGADADNILGCRGGKLHDACKLQVLG